MKRQIYADLDRGIDEAIANADRVMLESFTAPDFAEGVLSFVERREPQLRRARVGAYRDPPARGDLPPGGERLQIAAVQRGSPRRVPWPRGSRIPPRSPTWGAN